MREGYLSASVPAMGRWIECKLVPLRATQFRANSRSSADFDTNRNENGTRPRTMFRRRGNPRRARSRHCRCFRPCRDVNDCWVHPNQARCDPFRGGFRENRRRAKARLGFRIVQPKKWRWKRSPLDACRFDAKLRQVVGKERGVLRAEFQSCGRVPQKDRLYKPTFSFCSAT